MSSNASHGLDHGAWIPLSAFFPNADVPVVLVSLLENFDFEYHFRLGEVLGSLRNKGYLVLASGSATHNLGTFRSGHFSSNNVNYADMPNREFQDQLDSVLLGTEPERLLTGITALTRSTLYPQDHPTPEHFVPLVVALGAALKSALRKFHQSFQHSLSIAAYTFDEQAS
jgi:4,5-DOPA dioxygenase extradiol